ncbi:RHS repeat protein [Pseudomonas putida CSV86]|uniref:RHS repeat protein n=1 Tax=Pseudomonas bharatica CSV86 TaxID=1005395 RepID=A0A7K4EE72_9PSED|nr:RHS repeat protein [Pseudomonas bharatica]NNJ15958.1 RHS repeat protein [Pseudomonas bharatica CSV86]
MPQSNSLHRHTPNLSVVEGRYLPLRQVGYHRVEAQQPIESRIQLTHVDASGQWHGRWDARLFQRLEQDKNTPCNQQALASLSGRTVLNKSQDAGWQLALHGEAGQTVESWDTRGNHWQTEHDELLRPLLIRENGARVAERFTYSGTSDLNQRGRLVRHDDDAGSRLIDHYSLTGQAQSETRLFLASPDLPDWPDAPLEPGNGASTRFSYSPLGELLERTDALGNRERSRLNLSGELAASSLILADGTECLLLTDTRYNAFGQIESQTAGNGVISHAEYDPADGRLTRLSSHRPGRSKLQDLHYAYDPVGNVIRIEDHSQPVRHFANQRIDPVSTFAYDSLYQLTEATGREAAGATIGPALPDLTPDPGDTSRLLNYRQRYEYDASGNLLSLQHIGQQSYTRIMNVAEDSNHAVPEPGDPLTSFDANGNLHRLSPGQPLDWNARNQLHSTRQVTRDEGESDEEHYRYGGDGLRVRKVVTRLVSGRMQSSEVRYLPGLELHTRQGESFAVITTQAGRCTVRCLVWSEGQPGGIANPQLRYSLDDLLGSSALELDGEASITSHEGYYPFGGTAWWAAHSAVEASYKTRRYSGKERDSSGLYDYGHRYYAPWLARWINPDPAGDIDGANRFAFVRNNPLTLKDPKGLMNTSAQETHQDRARQEAAERRRRYVADPRNFSHEFSEDPAHPNIMVSIHVPEGADLSDIDTFKNKYKPHKWTFMDNKKPSQTREFYASDVAWVQYEKVSKARGFAGVRPSLVKRKTITNPTTLNLMTGLENGSATMMKTFFEDTPNGKSTWQILQDAQLRATGVRFKPGKTIEHRDGGILLSIDVLVSVEPQGAGVEMPSPSSRSPRGSLATDARWETLEETNWEDMPEGTELIIDGQPVTYL